MKGKIESWRIKSEAALETFKSEYDAQHQTRINRELHFYGRIVRSSALVETCRKSNAKLLLTGSNAPFDLSTTLLLGTCAMSDSIESGVVDAEGAVWNCPGLYIADGSCISASLGVNPYFTIAANAERITEAIIASV